MEKEHHQRIVHEEEEVEVEDAALERRKFLPKSKDDLVTGVLVSSSSCPPVGNGGMYNNGVCSVATDPDRSPIQKEDEIAEINIVGENDIHFKDDKVDQAAVGFGLVAEFVGAGATSSAAVSQNKSSVYFDKQQGMWKCHHCTWTKQFESPWTVPIWNPKGYPNSLTNVKTMIQHGQCFVCETKDNEVNGLNGVQNGDGARSVRTTNHGEIEFDVRVENSVIENSLCNEVNNQYMKAVDDKVTSSSELSSLHDSSAIQATAVTNLDDESCTKEGLNLIKEIDQQPKEFDVEAVLAKQETHDLFCPNCNSCITKRVILKKRKRNIHNLDNKAKRDKLNTIVSSNLIDSSPHEANQADQASAMSNVSLEIPADNYDHEREPEVFRCLSCFSFFIPTGKGFNLFRNFGGAREHETSQNPSSIPVSNLQNPSNLPGSNVNWFFSLFTSTKGKTAGDSSLEHSTSGPSEHHHSTSITSNMQTSTEIGHPEGPLSDTAIIKNAKPMPDVNHGHGGLNLLISSPVKSVKIETWMENDIKSNMASGKEPLADQKCFDSLFQNDLSSVQSCKKSAGDSMNGLQRVGEDFIDFSVKEPLLTGNERTNVGEKKNDSVDIIKTNNVEDMSSMSFSDEMLSKLENVQLATAATTEILVNDSEPTKDAILNPYEGEPQFRVPTTIESPILGNSQKDVDSPEIVQSSYTSLKQGAQSPIQSFGNTVLANDVASNKQSSRIDAIIPKKHDLTLTETLLKDVAEEINPSVGKENKGTDVIIFVKGEASESTTSQAADNAPFEGTIMTESRTRVSIGEQPTAEIGKRHEWEILKSIVYGGLIESITSLGIVSSAAGSGAAPLNIIALGLANLVGGLFILAHNLVELRNDQSRGDQQQTNTQDRYEELLGRRTNFLFHAVVAILSSIIFGSVPLVIFGLLINKNYYAEVKLAAVAATSVVCIIMLAIGKVYTKRPPKSYIKTVVYYVTLALAASGVSYIGGNLIKDLLEKFSHPGFAIVMPISDTSMEPALMSY